MKDIIKVVLLFDERVEYWCLKHPLLKAKLEPLIVNDLGLQPMDSSQLHNHQNCQSLQITLRFYSQEFSQDYLSKVFGKDTKQLNKA